MPGRLAREEPGRNLLISLVAAIITTLILWFIIAFCRWDFTINPGNMPEWQRAVLGVWFVIALIQAVQADPEDN